MPNGEGPAKFDAKPCDKWSGTEKDTMFCKLEIFGEEPPEVKWFKGFKDLSTDPRYKIWTDGDSNQAILGIEGLKQEDEGAYRCCINGGEENAAEGGVEHEFSIYVTGKSSHITVFPFPLYSDMKVESVNTGMAALKNLWNCRDIKEIKHFMKNKTRQIIRV